MRIVHVITRLILGGAQENTILTCEELARLGHEVVLVAGPTYGPEGSLLGRVRGGSYRMIEVPPLRRAVHPWNDWRACRALGALFRDLGPEVVHTHSSKAGILGRLAAHRARVPCVVHTVHGLAFDAYEGALANWAYRAADPPAAARMGARWSDAALQRFDYREATRHILDVYRGLPASLQP